MVAEEEVKCDYSFSEEEREKIKAEINFYLAKFLGVVGVDQDWRDYAD